MTTPKSPWDTTGPSRIDVKQMAAMAAHAARQTKFVEKQEAMGRNMGTVCGLSKASEASIRLRGRS